MTTRPTGKITSDPRPSTSLFRETGEGDDPFDDPAHRPPDVRDGMRVACCTEADLLALDTCPIPDTHRPKIKMR